MFNKNLFVISVITPFLCTNLPYPRNVINFHNFVTKAQSWGEKTYRHWKISKVQKQAIFDYTAKESKDINFYLKENQGKLLVPDTKQWKYWETIENYDLKKTNLLINHLDQALAAAETPETLIVYKRANEKFFDIHDQKLRFHEDFTINFDLFKTLKNQFLNKKMIIYNFLSTSLINEPDHFTFNHKIFPILFKIVLPKTTNAAYIGNISMFEGEIEMLITRDQFLIYQDFSITKFDGVETMVINAYLEKR